MPSDGKRAAGLVVTLMVGALVAAYLMPVAIGALSGPDTATYTQATGETVTLTSGEADLNATLDSVDTAASPSTATYTITYNSSSATATVGNGTSTSVTVAGYNVTISPSAISTSEATTTYEYPTTAGWTGATAALWNILPLLLVLPIFLLIVGWAIKEI